MNYGLKLNNLVFDGFFQNYRVTQEIDHEELGGTRDGTTIGNTFAATAVTVPRPSTHHLVFRRFIGIRTTYEGERLGWPNGSTTTYITYRYLILEPTTSESLGYGMRVLDAYGNSVFNTNNKYVKFFKTGTYSRNAGRQPIPQNQGGGYVYMFCGNVREYLFSSSVEWIVGYREQATFQIMGIGESEFYLSTTSVWADIPYSSGLVTNYVSFFDSKAVADDSYSRGPLKIHWCMYPR